MGFPWASHPTDQEPATHATVGTRSNTDPELRLRHPSNLLHELTHNVRLRVATTLIDAAAQMREYDIGDVLITEQDRILGVLTDRDIVVRGLAGGKDPARTTAGEIASGHLVTVAPDDPVSRAVELMREHAVRRLPVCQDGRPVGIVSIGDLAVEQDPRSALADISAAPANR